MYKSETNTDAIFLPLPPELITLASLTQQLGDVGPEIVYPGIPASIEEEGLFNNIAPKVRLFSMMEWTAETFQCILENPPRNA